MTNRLIGTAVGLAAALSVTYTAVGEQGLGLGIDRGAPLPPPPHAELTLGKGDAAPMAMFDERGQVSRFAMLGPGEEDPASGLPLQVVSATTGNRLQDVDSNVVTEFLTRQRLGVPQARLDYFRTRQLPGADDVQGWNGRLVSAIQTPDGIMATVRVTANLGIVSDTLSLMETYLINDEGVHFVGADSPPDAPRVMGH